MRTDREDTQQLLFRRCYFSSFVCIWFCVCFVFSPWGILGQIFFLDPISLILSAALKYNPSLISWGVYIALEKELTGSACTKLLFICLFLWNWSHKCENSAEHFCSVWTASLQVCRASPSSVGIPVVRAKPHKRFTQCPSASACSTYPFSKPFRVLVLFRGACFYFVTYQ